MERVVLLDTHVVVWAIDGARRLSSPAAKALKAASTRLLADISFREICHLARVGRIELDRDPAEWLEAALEELTLTVVPISPAIAARSTRIAQNFHGDPADQLIAATSIELDVPLITADELLRSSPAVRTIW